MDTKLNNNEKIEVNNLLNENSYIIIEKINMLKNNLTSDIINIENNLQQKFNNLINIKKESDEEIS